MFSMVSLDEVWGREGATEQSGRAVGGGHQEVAGVRPFRARNMTVVAAISVDARGAKHHAALIGHERGFTLDIYSKGSSVPACRESSKGSSIPVCA
jgi:hypothetical protein